jgi:hypothetical protein
MIGNIYLSSEQQIMIDDIRNKLISEIEKKDNIVIHKFNGIPVILSDIHIKFENGQLTTIYFNKELIGTCQVNRISETDIRYDIGKIRLFDEFRNRVKDFILTIGYSPNGCLGGYYSKAYDSITKIIVDFTEYN